jgi:hypothetical protein
MFHSTGRLARESSERDEIEVRKTFYANFTSARELGEESNQ